MPDCPKITYRYSRLTFHRDSIESLHAADRFRIETPLGAFVMSKQEFYDTFPKVVQSRAYLVQGLYNYAKVPLRAERFLVDPQPWAASSQKGQGACAFPLALKGSCTEKAYKRWLHRKAQAHIIRDRRRWKIPLSVAEYKKAIHLAVQEAGLHDAYTGELMDWHLISKYDNTKSKGGGTAYKKEFARLPTVDHASYTPGDMNFRICCWRTNDSKSDLDYEEFIALCRAVLKFYQSHDHS